MLDIQFIRENSKKIKEAISNRQQSVDIDDLLEVDKKLRIIKQEVDKLRGQRKIVADKQDIRLGKRIKDNLTKKEGLFKKLEEDFKSILTNIPNIPLDKVPIGKDEDDNLILRSGREKKFDFKTLDHKEIAENLDLIDFERGAKVTGSQFYFLKNEAVLLEQALIKYALEILKKNGFTLFETPDLAREIYYKGTGWLPQGPEAQTYEIKGTDLGLIATSEITLAGYHSDEILKDEELPKKYCAISHCFRREAGSYGKYSKGLYRVHQFTKVEMYIYCTSQDSAKMYDEIITIEEEVLGGLGIPYRVVELCTGQLGSQSARTIDLEARFPGRDSWGEVTSASNTTDYQTRRLNIRYRQRDGKIAFPYSLNGTVVTSSRGIVSILENYQQKDGSVIIPEVLREYMGMDKILPKNS